MRKIDSLTGVRIFAALAVLASHLPKPDSLPLVVRTFMDAGYNGVTLFFVLSGFVLAWTYAERLANPTAEGVRDFFAARIARIYPLYIVALAFAALPQISRLPRSALLHIFALQTWSPTIDVAYGLNGPGWSIGVEFFLYALFPPLLWGILRAPRWSWLWIATSAVTLLALLTLGFQLVQANALPWSDPSSAHRWLYRTPLTRIPDFVVGMVIALLVKRDGLHRWAASVQWISAGAMMALMASPPMLMSILSWDIGYLMPSAALIWSLAAAPTAPLARALSARPLVYGGTISYAVYLFHVPLVHHLNIPTLSLGSWAVGVAVAVFVVVAVGAGTHHMIEVPAQRWLRPRLSATRRQPISV